MSVAPSIQPQAATSPPPQNESGPTSCKVEPVKQNSRRARASAGEDHTRAAPRVKVEPVPAPFFNELAARVDAERAALVGLDDLRRKSFETIAKFLESQPLDVIRRGDTWELHFWGGKLVVIEGGENLMNPRRVEVAILHGLGLVLSLGSRDGWRLNAQAIVDAARAVESCTEEDETRGWILPLVRLDDDVLANCDRDGKPEDRARVWNYTGRGNAKVAWREGQSVMVNLPRLIGQLRLDGIRSLTLRGLSERVGRLGFESVHRGFRARSAGADYERGELIRARLWEIDIDVLTGRGDGADLEVVEAEEGE